MKILVAPLNWGLGHASRCVPLVRRFIEEGHEVILGGDGESLTLLRKHFPKLRYVYLAPLQLQYSAGRRQVGAMIRALPRLVAWAVKDHAMLKAVLREEKIDRVVSDNRFGLYVSNSPKGGPPSNSVSGPTGEAVPPQCVYITHQLHVLLPQGWRWAEPMAQRLHAAIYKRFGQVWVPDYEALPGSLSGVLGHPSKAVTGEIHYIGPLSRFDRCAPSSAYHPAYDVVAVLSGLEPHRTLLEKEIVARYIGTGKQVLVVQGLMHRPNTRIKRANITTVPYLGDAELAEVMKDAGQVIARSGYSTVMDLDALGLLGKAELIPTPGQPEQEYLACWIKERNNEQDKL